MDTQTKDILNSCSKEINCKLFYYKGQLLQDVNENLKKSITNQNTLKVYENRIMHLSKSKYYPFDCNFTLLNCFIEEVNETMNINSVNSCICNLLKFCELSDGFKNDVGDDNIKFLKSCASSLMTQSKLNQSKRKATDIEWSYLEELYDKLEDPKLNLNREDKLLYKLYIRPGIELMPRNDFSSMRIVNTFTDTQDTSFNYYIIDAKKMIFNEYKNSGSGGQIVRGVPDEIVNLINTNQKWLFEYREKRVVENTMAKKTYKIFNKLSDKNITINTIRRSYASKFKKTDNVADIIADAENSMHSVGTHLNYQTNSEPSSSACIAAAT